MTGVREFDTGATRNVDASKFDYDGFLSPLALERFAEYMHANRTQADGTFRDSDNWQKGIPFDSYMKSMWRHFFDVWKWHRGLPAGEDIETALCALMFNVQGYLHEHLKRKGRFGTLGSIHPADAFASVAAQRGHKLDPEWIEELRGYCDAPASIGDHYYGEHHAAEAPMPEPVNEVVFNFHPAQVEEPEGLKAGEAFREAAE